MLYIEDLRDFVLVLLLGLGTLWVLSGKRRPRLLPGVEYPAHRVSWIPYLGKALEMSSMPIREFILIYSKGDPMFTCTVAGDKCLFLADSNLVPLIYKDRPERTRFWPFGGPLSHRCYGCHRYESLWEDKAPYPRTDAQALFKTRVLG